MDLDKIELGILKIMSENGGTLPPDFFAKKMQRLVAKGAIQTVFENPQNMYKQPYHYKLVTPKKDN